MPAYYMLLNARRFHEQLSPALAAAWQQRSFQPCHAACTALLDEARTFAQRCGDSAESMLSLVLQGLPFDRSSWRLLAGEILLYAADSIPDIQTAPETLCCLAAPEHYARSDFTRDLYAPIQQAHFGARDLSFGRAFYRSEQAGFNDSDDVTRLAGYLRKLDPGQWSVADLQRLRGVETDDERADELEFAREWLPVLQDLYEQADGKKQVIVCELV